MWLYYPRLNIRECLKSKYQHACLHIQLSLHMEREHGREKTCHLPMYYFATSIEYVLSNLAIGDEFSHWSIPWCTILHFLSEWDNHIHGSFLLRVLSFGQNQMVQATFVVPSLTFGYVVYAEKQFLCHYGSGVSKPFWQNGTSPLQRITELTCGLYGQAGCRPHRSSL